MTVSDIFLTPARIKGTGISAPLALLGGLLLAIGLFWLAQGTATGPGAPDWHGNAAPSGAVVGTM